MDHSSSRCSCKPMKLSTFIKAAALALKHGDAVVLPNLFLLRKPNPGARVSSFRNTEQQLELDCLPGCSALNTDAASWPPARASLIRT